MPFLEVSAREGTNIDEVFYTLGRGIKLAYDKESKTDSGVSPTHLSTNSNKNAKDKKGCEC